MDRTILEQVSDYSRTRYSDNQFEYGRSSQFPFIFTRPGKSEHAPYSMAPPFTDPGSFQSRKYFTRASYEIQNPAHGALPIRGIQPRIKPLEVQLASKKAFAKDIVPGTKKVQKTQAPKNETKNVKKVPSDAPNKESKDKSKDKSKEKKIVDEKKKKEEVSDADDSDTVES